METQTLENPTFDTQDEFKRKPIAENIIRLLTSPIDLSPMVIDGGWGTGKTEFCQKLIRLMQQQHPDYRPVYSGLNLNQYGVASPCRTICTVCGFVALS